MNLADELARKSKELTTDMHSRLNRLPDIADYRAAFRAILDAHPDIAQAIADQLIVERAEPDANLYQFNVRVTR